MLGIAPAGTYSPSRTTTYSSLTGLLTYNTVSGSAGLTIGYIPSSVLTNPPLLTTTKAQDPRGCFVTSDDHMTPLVVPYTNVTNLIQNIESQSSLILKWGNRGTTNADYGVLVGSPGGIQCASGVTFTVPEAVAAITGDNNTNGPTLTVNVDQIAVANCTSVYLDTSSTSMSNATVLLTDNQAGATNPVNGMTIICPTQVSIIVPYGSFSSYKNMVISPSVGALALNEIAALTNNIYASIITRGLTLVGFLALRLEVIFPK